MPNLQYLELQSSIKNSFTTRPLREYDYMHLYAHFHLSIYISTHVYKLQTHFFIWFKMPNFPTHYINSVGQTNVKYITLEI